MAKRVTKTGDDKTLDLINEVKKRKAEIAKLKRPNWMTNCSMQMPGKTRATNLHVETNVSELVQTAAFLLAWQREYEDAVKVLEVEAPPYKYAGFSTDEWICDIKTRIDQINISSKQRKLEQLEARLNAIISPELKAQLELEAIEKELE